MTTRTVLITGGSNGIGLGLAARYRARGDRVVVTGRDSERLARAAGRVPGLETLVGDVGDPAGRERLAGRVIAEFPDLDVLVQNAGAQRRVALAVDDAPWAAVQAELDTLLAGPIHLNRLLVPVLLAHGRPAVIVDVTSGGAFVPQPFAPVYSAAKAALHSYTVNLRFALAATACRVVELVPPAVATGLAGVGATHGADLDEFCDRVFPLLDGRHDVVGFGPTADPGFTRRIDDEARAFAASSARFPVERYASGVSEIGERAHG